MLQKLDLTEFYQDSNGSYIKKGGTIPEGLGGIILITPKQCIGVYNKEALDNEDNMVSGLGSHGETLNLILAGMFNELLNVDFFRQDRILNKIIPGKELNYICMRLVNASGRKMVIAEIPSKVSTYQLKTMEKLDQIFKNLEVSSFALIRNFDPSDNNNLDDFKINDNLIFDCDLETAIKYLKEHNLVKENMMIVNQTRNENEFLYQKAKKQFYYKIKK